MSLSSSGVTLCNVVMLIGVEVSYCVVACDYVVMDLTVSAGVSSGGGGVGVSVGGGVVG